MNKKKREWETIKKERESENKNCLMKNEIVWILLLKVGSFCGFCSLWAEQIKQETQFWASVCPNIICSRLLKGTVTLVQKALSLLKAVISL